MLRQRFFVAGDLGQVHDPTALAVLEYLEQRGEWDPVAFMYRKNVWLRLRYLERMPLGTTYPDVVRRMAEVTRSRELAGCCGLVLDGTGVGRPVVDMAYAARLGCTISPVMVTSGMRESLVEGYYHVPKRDLITGLQAAMQMGLLQIAAGMPYVPELMQEMADMRVKISAAGNEQFGAWREGQHDDLVFAVALACWGARKRYPFELSGRQRYWV